MLMYTYTYMYVYMCVCVYIYIYICAVIPHTALLSHSELPQGKFLHRDSPSHQQFFLLCSRHIQCKSLLILILASWYQYRKYSTANIWPKCQSFPFVLVCPNITDMYFIGLLMWGKDQNDWEIFKRNYRNLPATFKADIKKSDTETNKCTYVCPCPSLGYFTRGYVTSVTDLRYRYDYHICLSQWYVFFARLVS